MSMASKEEDDEPTRKIVAEKKRLAKEFKNTSQNFSEFCWQKLQEAGLTEEQNVLASSLADLAIGIGRLQMAYELRIKRQMKNTVAPIRVKKPKGA